MVRAWVGLWRNVSETPALSRKWVGGGCAHQPGTNHERRESKAHYRRPVNTSLRLTNRKRYITRAHDSFICCNLAWRVIMD